MDEEASLELGLSSKRCKLSLKGRRNSARHSIAAFMESNLLLASPEILNVPTNDNFCAVPATNVQKLEGNSDCLPLSTLPNIGNTCFMNSVLHVLRITPNFIPWLHKATIKVCNRTCPSELTVLHKIYQILRELEKHKNFYLEEKEELESNLQSFLNFFANHNPQFTAGQQFDAHEFLCWLITIFQEPFHANKRSSSNDFVQLVVEGRAKNVIFCNECETSTSQEGSFWDLKVPLSTVYECEENDVRASFNANTVLCGEDKYLCSMCLQLTEARHSLRILDLPAILVVHIPSKWQNSEEDVPLKISESLPCIKDNCRDNCNDITHTFRLYAMLVHIGSSFKFGHYISLMRKPCEIPSAESTENKRYHTRSHQMIWEDCCQASGLESDKWVLCDDDKVASLDNLAQYFETVPLGSCARPSVLWYQRKCLF